MCKYYDGTKLLSMKDISGNTPEIYMCTTNRTGGKTTYFSRLLVNRFMSHGDKFCLLYRYNYELDSCADKFYKDISTLFFHGTEMSSKSRSRGIFHDLFIDGVHCGYALSMNSADQIKKFSHLFSDVSRIFFDEFQSETNHYCPNEVNKFISIHTSIARGQGKQIRYVPVYMCANPVSLINPYYVELGISERIQADTKFLRGDGFVLEQGFVSSASDAQRTSPFAKAFNRNHYISYSAECVYLNDNKAFIDKPQGHSRYLCTLKYKGASYAIREYADIGILYCDDRVDHTNPNKITVTTDDHEINYVMIKRNDIYLNSLRFFFERGCFRFKNLRCKEAVLKALSY